jgi:hypothetical protein
MIPHDIMNMWKLGFCLNLSILSLGTQLISSSPYYQVFQDCRTSMNHGVLDCKETTSLEWFELGKKVDQELGFDCCEERMMLGSLGIKFNLY